MTSRLFEIVRLLEEDVGASSDEQGGLHASELEAPVTLTAASPSRLCRRPLPRAAVLLAVLGATALMLLTPRRSQGEQGGKVASGAAGLQRIRPDYVVAEYQPLYASIADKNVPGMPAGEDSDSIFPTLTTTLQGLLTPPPPTLQPVSSCCESEEMFGALCYKKCETLTNGTHPTRTSAYTCCKTPNLLMCLLPANFVSSMNFPGSGYDVDGEGNIPHPPGFCEDNEEVFLDKCYAKCSILTSGKYPMRVAPNTCCKNKPCFSPFDIMTSGQLCTGFGVGGGYQKTTEDNGAKEEEPECPHPPLPKASGDQKS